MKNILKFLFLFLLLPFSLQSCRDDINTDWKEGEPSFKLYDTSLSSNVLYSTMENNPITFVWDNTLNGDKNYKVLISTTENFAQSIELGTSTTNSYTTTVGAFNTLLLQANYSPFASGVVYLRIANGTLFSNAISFTVTPYAVAKPVITKPTNGNIVVLDITKPAEIISVTWADYSDYGVDVKYVVDIAKKGGDFINLGTVTSTKANPKRSLDMTSKDFVFALLKIGGTVDVESDFDLRVTANTEFVSGGDPEKISDIVSFKAKPYVVSSYLYAPGAYQGWTPATANTLTSLTSNGEYEGYIDFKNAGDLEFKLTPERNWDNGYGTDDGVHLILNGGGNLKAAAVGSQKITVNLNDKTYKLIPYAWGIIGSASPGGWDADTNMHWNDATKAFEIDNVVLTAGEIKFRLNGGWDVNYGGTNGNAEAGGGNIKVDVAGNYKISLDLVNLKYKLTKL